MLECEDVILFFEGTQPKISLYIVLCADRHAGTYQRIIRTERYKCSHARI